MSDILVRAEALEAAINDASCNIDEYYHGKMQALGEQAIELIMPMAAEVKRLKSFADDLMGNCNALRTRAQNAEAQIQRLGALAFMKNLPADQIIDHFISWGNAAYEDQKRQAAYVTRLEAAYLAARRTIEWDAIDRDELNRHYTNISAPWMDAKTKGDLIEQRISKSLGRIKRGEQE